MNCQEALSLLYDIIDREASEVDTKEVKAHLEKCQHCSQIYKVEQEVHAFLKAKCQQAEPEEHLVTLKSKVATLLDTEDGVGPDPLAAGGAGKHGNPPITSLRLGRYLAAAAALVVLVWGAFVAADLFRHQAEHYELEQYHFAAREAGAMFADTDVTGTAMSYCAAAMRYVPGETVKGYELIGGREIQIDGAHGIHLLYADGSSHVSVFLAKADQFTIPASLKENAVTRGDLTFYDHHCRGCRLVYHQVGDVVVITATEERDIDLLQFVPGSPAV
ncbi:hypothetical protein GF420_11770 [candidate division GN15 bacterium]|nr:hypothetical protein [candidate division GN15 bacterium]